VTTTYEPNVVLSQKEFKTIGTRPIRHDGADKVTGVAKYGADQYPTGLLFGKILRSPHAHAKIKSIDTSKAEAHPGVRAVTTAADFPQDGEHEDLRESLMASKKVLYKGHPIAAVAANSIHDAEEAVNLIKVEYEVLPAIMTAPKGLEDGAPILHEKNRSEYHGDDNDTQTNIEEYVHHVKGDVEKGFAEADVVLERTFDTATVHQGYIEPQNTTVQWKTDGRIHIWCSTQGPFEVRDGTAHAVGIPESQVVLTPQEIGGGFGGKFEPYGAPLAAYLSQKTNRPVKIIMTRTEDLEASGPTPGSRITVKMAATNDGKITAAKATLAYEAGAYAGSMVSAGALCILAPYDLEHAEVEGFGVYINKPSTNAYRAPGATNAEFASESVVNELADKLGMDSIEFRLLNGASQGSRRVDGPVFPAIGMTEVLNAMKSHPHYSAPLEGPNRGRGVAIGWWMNGGGPSSVTINVHADGRCSLVEGSPDIGGSRTSISMQAAEVLGIPAEDFTPMIVSTDEVGFTAGTGGSRVTFATGMAAHDAAQDVKGQMVNRAALIWDVDADSVELADGVFQSKTDTELKMSFKELAGQIEGTGNPIVGRGTVDASGEGSAFCGNIVDLEVDPDTGKVQILRFTTVQDVGKAIHPSYVEGQMQGGSVQGIGWALNEEYFMTDDGRMANSTFLDYRMPVANDLPMIDTVIVEVANPGHPFGVRGVGEVNIVPPPAAIANAISRAIGVRMDKLPMNPGAIMETVWGKNRS
jgi:xanthine dehydrogenase molybdenum-binding subunit